MPGSISAVDAALVLRTLARATPDPIYVLDRDGRYTFVNESGAKSLGLAPDRIIGRTRTEIALPPEREHERVVQPLVDDDGVAHGEVIVYRKQQTLEQHHRVLLDVAEKLSTERDLEKILRIVTEGAMKLAGAESGTFSFAPSFSGAAAERVNDVHDERRLPSYLAVPVVSRTGDVIGGFTFEHSEASKFSEEEEELVSGVAAQAAIAIDNARLLEEATRSATRVQREEERYRTLVEATAQMVWSVDARGVGREELATWLGGVHPADVDRAAADWHRALESLANLSGEFRFRVDDGSYRWFAVRGSPVRDEDGSVREWIGTAADIDDRKRSEEKASFLADASALLTSSLDVETILTRLAELAVPRLADWCAIDVAQAKAPRRRLIITHPDPEKAAMVRAIDREYRLPREIDPIERVIVSGEPLIVERISSEQRDALAQDERHRDFIRTLDARSWLVVPIFAGGRTYGSLTLVHSESGRHFSERDLKFIEDVAARAGVAVYNAQLYVAAQAANRAKDDFLATLSHELRTPMTSILGWSRLLELGDLEPEIRDEALASIGRGARVQAQLIDDLLDVSRITVGKMHLHIESIDLGDIVKSAIDSVRPAADAKGQTIDVEIERDCPRVAGDPNRLQQVIWNLANNSVKFTPNGGRIDVSVFSAEDGVRVRVTDTGEGLAAEFLPVIFDRFRQVDSTTTRRFGGLGLGLAIVKQISELHGGSVRAESDGIGKGATFTVTLPKATARTVAHDASPSRGEVISLSNVDVLVVDDDPNAQRFVAAALEHAGARVRVASTVDEALKAIRSGVPNVLVTDIAMPDRDGFSLVHDVRNLLRIDEAHLPAIAMSAFGRAEDRLRILAAGFQRYMVKPIDPSDLTRAVAGLANRA